MAIAMTVALTAHGENKKAPEIKFDTVEHDFGNIKEADGPVSYTFEYLNEGNAPLVVQAVSVNCGCTTKQYTKKPVAPGKRGAVTLSFSPRGYKGAFTKSATVTTNVKGKNKKVTLKFTGNVIPQ